jgi:hypothetical protein
MTGKEYIISLMAKSTPIPTKNNSLEQYEKQEKQETIKINNTPKIEVNDNTPQEIQETKGGAEVNELKE